MAEKNSNNPYANTSDDDLKQFYDRYSPAYMGGFGVPKNIPQDSLLHQLDLAGEELKRRESLSKSPQDSVSINERSAKRTQEILDGNEYRKRHGLSHSGFDENHKPWLFTGSAYSDHDELVKLLRKGVDKVKTIFDEAREAK